MSKTAPEPQVPPSEGVIASPEDRTPPNEDPALLRRLSSISPPTSSGPVIAIDLDDVLSQTNIAVARWHNEVYGTQMGLEHFYYYYYWKNPFWGTLEETFRKVKGFYATDLLFKAEPVPGAREGIATLKSMGFKLIVVTARTPDVADESWKWISRHFPDMFHTLICTGQFKDAHTTGHEVVTKLSKAQVCADLEAQLLIDDSAENAFQCATHPSTPTRTLLFGDYEWNKRRSQPSDSVPEMAFDLRLEKEGGNEFWKEEEKAGLGLPKGSPLWRVKDWAEVIRWVQKTRKEGNI